MLRDGAAGPEEDPQRAALSARVAQLEADLRATSERLLKTLDDKDAAEKDLESLRAEAHDVIRQWEEENSLLRQKLDAALLDVQSVRSESINKENVAIEMKNKVIELQGTVAAQLTRLASNERRMSEQENEKTGLRRRTAELETENGAFRDRVTECEGRVTTLMHQVAHLERLREDDADEIVRHKASTAQALTCSDELRSELARSRDEVVELESRVQGAACRADAERAHYEGERLALVQSSREELERMRAQLESKDNELEDAFGRLAASDEEVRRLKRECSELETKLDVMGRRAVSNEQSMQDQMDVIKSLESDVRCQRELCQTLKNNLVRVQAENERMGVESTALRDLNRDLSSELDRCRKANEEFLTQMDRVSQERHGACAAMTREMDGLRMALSEQGERYRLEKETFAHRSDALHAECAALKLKLLSQNEEGARLSVDGMHAEGLLSLYSMAYHGARAMVERATVVAGKMREALGDADASREYAKKTNDTLSLQLRSALADVEQLRKTNGGLEQSLTDACEEAAALTRSQQALEREKAWMEERLASMREELAQMDELLNTSLDSMREENERAHAEVHRLHGEVEDDRKIIDGLQDQLRELAHEKACLHNDYEAIRQTMEVTRAGLLSAQRESKALSDELERARGDLRASEKQAHKQQQQISQLKGDVAHVNEQMRTIEERAKAELAERANDVVCVQRRLREAMDRAEQAEARATATDERSSQLQSSLTGAKDNFAKVKSAFENLRERCATDAELIKQLIQERDNVVKERDVIVERYNRLHDNFCAWRKKLSAKVATELRKLIDLCTGQESELTQLRNENKVLKNSISMFISTAQPKAEAVFTERLNLTEGPRRHPKKWTSSVEEGTGPCAQVDLIADSNARSTNSA